MRGHVPGLEAPHPLTSGLPALYQTDPFAQQLVSAFDEVLAPVHASLDNLDAYFDPWLAPDDYVDVVADWVGAETDATWDGDRQRAAVARASELYGSRGTAKGLAAQIELVTGGTAEITESGATGWSTDVTAPLPGKAELGLSVRVLVDDPKSVDAGRLERLVAAAKPAHVPHAIEVVEASKAGKGRG
jgi:phage tail-like protein